MSTRVTALGALLAALLAGLSVAPAALAADACGKPGYAYAGRQHAAVAHGVDATLTALDTPQVQSGHVAAWIGVGGVGLGPGGTTEWLQVGLSGFSVGPSRLYYEVAQPFSAPRYVEIDSSVEPGERHRVTVLEMSRQKDWWRVWVDGQPVSEPILLPGSSGRWQPLATAESWDGGQPACNRFSYAFDDVRVAAAPGGSWRRFRPAWRLEDPGYRVLDGARGSFVASASL